MRHLQWLASFNKNPILSTDPSARHDSCRGRQPERAGASNGQHCDGSLEGKAHNNLYLGDIGIIIL